MKKFIISSKKNCKAFLFIIVSLVFITSQAQAENFNGDGTPTITASGEKSSKKTKEKAFDGDVQTKWLTFEDSCWIQYDYPGNISKVVNGYSITSAKKRPERDPKKWRFLASNNGSSWVTLDTRSDESFAGRVATNTYKFTNTKAYKMYKLNILSNKNPSKANATQIAEIVFHENENIAPVITASGEKFPKESKEKAFDGDIKTKWLTFEDSCWIQYDYPGNISKVVNGYSITSAKKRPERDPKNWVLLGANEGDKWTVLDTRNDESFAGRFTTNTYTFENSTPYQKYRLEISSNNNPKKANSTQIAEIELLSECDLIDGGKCTTTTTLNEYGLGSNQSEYAAVANRRYDWYMDQYGTGPFDFENCGPTSATMSIKWADPSFNKTPEDARDTYKSTGGWWYTSDIIKYLDLYNINNDTINVNGSSDVIKEEIDNGNILILCINVSKLSYNPYDNEHVDRFYNTGTGHFIVAKGYTVIDNVLYFEVYDPNSWNNKYPASQQKKGKNRYLKWNNELSEAVGTWWDYAIVVNPKTRSLSSRAQRNPNIVDTDSIEHMPGGTN